MIPFACPSCHAHFEANDEQQGQDFICTTCGTALKVPPAFRPSPSPLWPSAAIPVVGAAARDTSVRFFSKGEDFGTFHTSASPAEIYQEIEDLLRRLGLRVDDEWGIHGMINHPLSFFCEIRADGVVKQRDGGREIVLDLSWRTNLPLAAILIAIFVFPVGLILALVFYNQAPKDVRRLVANRLDDLRQSLTQRI